MESPSSRVAGEITSVEVRTPGRLHLGMLSFGRDDVRSFGGVGIMIERPAVHIRVAKAAAVTARGLLSDRAAAAAEACMRYWGMPPSQGCAIEVLSVPREHVGLGCGTQLSLAVAAAIRELHRGTSPEERTNANELVMLETSDVFELARAVGRGRRSCIGVHGFVRGGLIFEAGRFLPGKVGADGGAAEEFSPLISRIRLPSTWRCVVVMQKGISGLHGDKEKKAFEELPAAPIEVTNELSRIALLDLLPAATAGDFGRFADAVTRYGGLAGKPFEPITSRLQTSEVIRDMCELLEQLGARGVTQSSWGPTVIACCESLNEAAGLLEQIDALELGDHLDVMIAKFDNTGAAIRRIG